MLFFLSKNRKCRLETGNETGSETGNETENETGRLGMRLGVRLGTRQPTTLTLTESHVVLVCLRVDTVVVVSVTVGQQDLQRGREQKISCTCMFAMVHVFIAYMCYRVSVVVHVTVPPYLHRCYHQPSQSENYDDKS